MPAPFAIQPVYTAIAIAYHNLNMVADRVMPRVPVSSELFKYLKHNLADGYTIPDTKVGRTSAPNEVEFSAEELGGTCVSYGLIDPVPQIDIDNAPPNYDPMAVATEKLMNLISLDREKRVADATFDPANYGANTVVLAGSDQFSHADSDPIDRIMSLKDEAIMPYNKITMGRSVYTKIVQHPKIVGAYLGNEGTSGIASRQFLADLFEVDEILVGEAFVNTAKPGQAVSLSRCWGKHLALHYCDMLGGTSGTTWGFTAEFGTRIAAVKYDEEAGARGTQRLRVVETVAEVVAAPELGYLLQNAVA